MRHSSQRGRAPACGARLRNGAMPAEPNTQTTGQQMAALNPGEIVRWAARWIWVERAAGYQCAVGTHAAAARWCGYSPVGGGHAPTAHRECCDPRIDLRGAAAARGSQEAALWHGKQRASLEARGLKPAFADGQIAAIAATQGLVLVTRNTSDFEVFEGLEVLNWVRES